MPRPSKFAGKELASLRRHESVLREVDVDPSGVRVRSAVFQRHFRRDAEPVPVYAKVYAYPKHPFQRLFRQGRARCEARNLLFFRSLGIPAAPVLAWGTRRNPFGGLRREFIITEAIEDARPLDAFLRSEPLSRRERLEIVLKMAGWLRALHSRHFFHKDLHWRNLLIRREAGGPALFWIDCPRGGFHRLPLLQRHWRLKDCATLDKYARLFCSPGERLRFLAAYLEKPLRSPEVRDYARTIEAYRTQRFDQRKGRRKVVPPPSAAQQQGRSQRPRKPGACP